MPWCSGSPPPRGPCICTRRPYSPHTTTSTACACTSSSARPSSRMFLQSQQVLWPCRLVSHRPPQRSSADLFAGGRRDGGAGKRTRTRGSGSVGPCSRATSHHTASPSLQNKPKASRPCFCPRGSGCEASLWTVVRVRLHVLLHSSRQLSPRAILCGDSEGGDARIKLKLTAPRRLLGCVWLSFCHKRMCLVVARLLFINFYFFSK